MTDLRDARLQRALHEAPDAGAVPAQRVRDAIRAAAHDAVRPWWQRWLPAGRTARWAPAFATVLLAGLVTVLWQGREVPDARVGADVAAPVGAPAPAPSSPTVLPEATKPAPAPARTDPAPAAAKRAPPQAPAAAPRERAEPLEQAAVPPPPPALAEAAPPATAAPPVPAAAPAPAPALESRARGFAAQRQPLADDGAPRWTQLRVESDGTSVVLPRDQAGTLPALLARMLRAESVAAPAGTPQLRLELAQDGEPVGVLESVGGEWRWQPAGEAAAARGLRPPAALDAQLRAEAERLLRR